MPITQWFNQFDPYFERPFDALHLGGYSAVELCGEYHRVFGNGDAFHTNWIADYRKYMYR